MTFHSQVKRVSSNGAGTLMYEIFVNHKPLDPEVLTAYAGDVYVYISSTQADHAVHIYDGATWIQWDPKDNKQVLEMADTMVRPQPCAHQGLRYVPTSEEMVARLEEVVSDIPTIAELIAKDCKYPELTQQASSQKRPAEAVISPLRRKRVCTSIQTTPAVSGSSKQAPLCLPREAWPKAPGKRKKKATSSSGEQKDVVADEDLHVENVESTPECLPPRIHKAGVAGHLSASDAPRSNDPMPWSSRITSAFATIEARASVGHENQYYGPYNKLLCTLFPPDSDFIVSPNYILGNSDGAANFFVSFEITLRQQTVLILQAKPPYHLELNSTREAADRQIRRRLVDLSARALLPIFYGISAIGTKLCFYEFERASKWMTPRRVPSDPEFTIDVAPQERWDCDVLAADGGKRLQALATRITRACEDLDA